MLIMRKFWSDTRGAVKTIAAGAGAVALASVGIAGFLDNSLHSGAIHIGSLRGAPSSEFVRVASSLPRPGESERGSLRQVTVDYMPTGSLPANLAQPIVLDPCTGQRK
jgi:hypothetical protein